MQANKRSLMSFCIFIMVSYSALGIVDTNPSNNFKNITISVATTQKLELTFIPIDNPLDFNVTVLDFIKFFNATYPVAGNYLTFTYGKPYASLPEEKSDLDRLLSKLARRGILSYKRTIGVVPKYWFKNYTVLATADGYTLVQHGIVLFPGGIAEARNQRHIAAHEIGHTFGLCDEHSSSYWNSQNKIAAVPGFCPNGDVDNNEVLDSNCEPLGCATSTINRVIPWINSTGEVNLYNLMGSADQDSAWISNESYLHLLNKFKQNSLIAVTGLVLSGIINKSSEAIDVYPSYIINNVEITQPNTTVNGNYSIEILDNDSQVTSKINFTPSFLDVGFNGSSIETNIIYFIVVMNFSSNNKGFRIKNNDVVKKEINKTPNTPSLNLTFPFGNEVVSNKMNITYNSSDSDGDIPNYAILISSDNGSSYSTLDIDVVNKSFFVNTSDLPEGKNYLVKVLATDGINTNTTVSENTFEIDNDLRITNLTTLNQNSTKEIFYYETKNTLETPLTNVSEQLNTGESTVQFTTNHSLNSNENIMVFVAYDYNTTGTKTLTATATSGSYVEIESSTIIVPDIEIKDFMILNQSITKRLFGFIILNNLNQTISNLNWTLSTHLGNISLPQFVSLTSNQNLFNFVFYDFVNKGNYNITITASNGSINASQSMVIKVKDIRVDNLTVAFDNNTNKIFNFIISNDWNSSLPAVNWTLNNSQNITISNNLISLVPGENILVYVNSNFTSTGNFNVNASAINGTTLDSELTSVSVT